MSELQIQPINDGGIQVQALPDKNHRFHDLRLYEQDGHVNVYATVRPDNEHEIEALMYLSPEEAMKVANALRASAIKALEHVSA